MKRTFNSKNFIVVDISLGGDGGKGTIIDSLCRQYKADCVVKYTSGAQCAHNVVDINNLHHCFSQFGSGHLVAGVKTFLSQYFLINPFSLEREEECLKNKGITDNFERLFIDQRAVITTPYHIIHNKLTELYRGKDKHSSCAMGIWSSEEDRINRPDLVLRISDLFNSASLYKKLKLISLHKQMQVLNLPKNTLAENQDECNELLLQLEDERYLYYYVDKYIAFSKKIQVVKTVSEIKKLLSGVNIFEGGQSIGLDAVNGFLPYVTGNSTTTQNAEKILKEIEHDGKKEVIGITRTYISRHGLGPLPTENFDTNLISDDHNQTNKWQGNLRTGNLDLVLLANAIKVNRGIDYLAITHVDKLNLKENWQVCTEYQSKSNDEDSATLIRYVLQQGLQRHCEDFAKMLEDAKPFYTTVHKDSVIDLISNTLNVPVKIISSGQTYKDKQYLS